METRDKTFVMRFSLTATMPEALWADDDFEEDAWLTEWEAAIKPGVIRAVFSHLRSFPNWEAHVRNRGISPLDEIEIVLERSFSVPPMPGTHGSAA
jgi:DNA-binding SARP family transcriptional activator